LTLCAGLKGNWPMAGAVNRVSFRVLPDGSLRILTVNNLVGAWRDFVALIMAIRHSLCHHHVRKNSANRTDKFPLAHSSAPPINVVQDDILLRVVRECSLIIRHRSPHCPGSSRTIEARRGPSDPFFRYVGERRRRNRVVRNNAGKSRPEAAKTLQAAAITRSPSGRRSPAQNFSGTAGGFQPKIARIVRNAAEAEAQFCRRAQIARRLREALDTCRGIVFLDADGATSLEQ